MKRTHTCRESNVRVALLGRQRLRAAAVRSADDAEKVGSRTIANKLHVDALLTGTVNRAGPRVRVTARLTEARDYRQIWWTATRPSRATSPVGISPSPYTVGLVK